MLETLKPLCKGKFSSKRLNKPQRTQRIKATPAAHHLETKNRREGRNRRHSAESKISETHESTANLTENEHFRNTNTTGNNYDCEKLIKAASVENNEEDVGTIRIDKVDIFPMN